METKDDTIDVRVTAGERDDKRYFFKDAGNQLPYRRSGDVIVNLNVMKHPIYERIGDHLYLTITLSLKEALLGFSRTYRFLNGKQLVIESRDITQPKSIKTYVNNGMKRFEASGYGNLYVEFEVEFPRSLSEEAAKELASIIN